MIYPINHFPVNWIDGMKISKNHFIDTDRHSQDAIRDAVSVSLNYHNFGLLPSPQNTRATFELSYNEHAGNAVEVVVRYCNAVTPGGSRITVSSALSDNGELLSTVFANPTEKNTNNETSWFDVVLIVNPFERRPIGNPDLEENPPRHPYTDHNYRLEVIASTHINKSELGPYHIVIGRIKSTGGKLYPITMFIPPCTCVESHPALIKSYENFIALLQNTNGHALKIIKKIFEKNKPSSIAKNYKILCEKILEYNARVLYDLRNTIPQSSPVYLIGCFSSLANTIYTALYLISSEEREELLKYTFEWCDVTPNEFEESLLNTLEIKYNHYKIAETLEIVGHFLTILSNVFARMDSLEFIGQRKENIVVTKSDIQQQPMEQPKKRWSILD